MPIFANKRDQGLYNHHYSDLSADMGAPIGSIIAVYVDAHSTSNVIDKDKVAYNYPGYVYCEGQDLNISDFPLLYEVLGNKYGGDANVNIKNWNGSKTGRAGHTAAGTDLGTFKVPDLRMKRINGPGGIDGAGSITPDDAAMEVGDVGGEWYISRARQLKEYSFGSARVSGYDSVTAFITGSLTGQATLTIGPLEEKTLSGPPPHNHTVLTSGHDQRQTMESGSTSNYDNQKGYETGYGAILDYDPERGTAASHTHWLALERPVKSGSDAALDEPKDMYSYDIAAKYAHENAAETPTDAEGQAEFTTTVGVDKYDTWIVPSGVTEISVLCVGGGAGGGGGNLGGGGGALAWISGMSVTPGTQYNLKVGKGGVGDTGSIIGTGRNGGTSYFNNYSTCAAGGGGVGRPGSHLGGLADSTTWQGGTAGGGGMGGDSTTYGGGGGAAGYAGNGGGGTSKNAPSGSGGAGAGGAYNLAGGVNGGAGGGGVGKLGIGSDGIGGNAVTSTYSVVSGGQAGSGGLNGENTASPQARTKNWVAVNAGNISSGSAAVWTQFMLDYAIYPAVQAMGTVDPYLGQAQVGGAVLDVPAAGYNSVTIEMACDNQGILSWLAPNGSTLTTQSFNSVSTPTPSTPSTSVTLTGLTEGPHIITFQVTNISVPGNDTWTDNPAGIAWKITDNSNATVILNSRTECTGGSTVYNDAFGGDGQGYGAGGGANYHHSSTAVASDPGDGGPGIVRIIWGSGRSFPSAAGDTSNTDYSGGGTSDAYVQDGPAGNQNIFGIHKWNDGKANDNGKTVNFISQDNMSVDPSGAGISMNEGTLTMTGAESISVAPAIVPRQAVPLVLKYFRVKYLIKAY